MFLIVGPSGKHLSARSSGEQNVCDWLQSLAISDRGDALTLLIVVMGGYATERVFKRANQFNGFRAENFGFWIDSSHYKD